MVAALLGAGHRGPTRSAADAAVERDGEPTRPVEVAAVTASSDGGRAGHAAAELRGISKRFGATQALDDVSLELLPGEVHGAGRRERGRQEHAGQDPGRRPPAGRGIDPARRRADRASAARRTRARWASPSSTRSRGSSRTCRSPRTSSSATRPRGAFGSIDWGRMRARGRRLFEELDVRIDVGAPVRGLSMADQQLIEIAKALSVERGSSSSTSRRRRCRRTRSSACSRSSARRATAASRSSSSATGSRRSSSCATARRSSATAATSSRPRRAELTTADLVRHMVGRDGLAVPEGRDARSATSSSRSAA